MDTSARAQDSSSLSISTISEDLTITGSVTFARRASSQWSMSKATCTVSRLYSERMQQLEGNGGGGCDGPWPTYRLRACAKRMLQSTAARRRQPRSQEFSPSNTARNSEGGTASRRGSRRRPTRAEVPGAEPQLNHDGHSETVNQRERGNGFIRSLPVVAQRIHTSMLCIG